MPRPKGSATIKHLDATKQDAVSMRSSLWHGRSDNPQEELRKLHAEQARLEERLRELHDQKELGISATETELRNIKKQIRALERQITRKKRPVFAWQAKAVQLIELHKYIHKPAGAGSMVVSTQGATASTRWVQEQLREAGFEVDDRQLRRFMRKCGVAGQQGKRTKALFSLLALVIAATATAQEVRRAIPVVEPPVRRAIPVEIPKWRWHQSQFIPSADLPYNAVMLAFEGGVEDGGKQGVQLGGGLGLCGGYAVLLFHSFQSTSVASAIVSAD